MTLVVLPFMGSGLRRITLTDRILPADEADEDHHHRHDEQQVDESVDGDVRDEPEDPEDQEDRCDGIEHGIGGLVCGRPYDSATGTPSL